MTPVVERINNYNIYRSYTRNESYRYHIMSYASAEEVLRNIKVPWKLENMLKAKRDDVQNCRKNCTYLPIDVFRKVLEISILVPIFQNDVFNVRVTE